MLQKALVNAVTKLEEVKSKGLLSDFILIGGFAVSAWGYPRATDDIDFAIKLNREKLLELAEHLKAILKQGDDTDPLVAILEFESLTYPVQLMVFPKNWEDIAFSEVKLAQITDLELPLPNWKSLVLLQLYAGSEADLYDAKRILDIQGPGTRAEEVLRETARRLRVSKKFDRMLKINER